VKTIAIALFGCVIAAELVLRFLPVQSGLRALPVDDAHPVAKFTPNRPYVFSLGWSLSLVNRGRINNDGFVNDQDYDSTATSPLVAVIGSDDVEGSRVPYDSSVQGELARALGGRERVYSFGGAGAALPQFLAWADYARQTFRPTHVVVVITPTDADHSQVKYWQDHGFYHFRETEDGGLELMRLDYEPSRIRQLVRTSALARYLIMNGQSILAHEVGSVDGSMPAEPDAARTKDSERAVDKFLAELPSHTGLPPQRIVLVINSTGAALYDPRARDAGASTYAGHIRRYIAEHGQQGGFQVLDMEPIFEARFARDSVRFESPIEAHWNAAGHRVAAEAIANSLAY